MWIKTSGALSENVYQLTTSVSTHLLAVGDASVLVDTGISSVHGRLTEELQRYLGGEEGRLDFIFLTHAHFDHLGGIPYLRKAFPGIMVLGGPQTSEILGKAEVLDLFYEKNLACAQAMNTDLQMSKEEWTAAIQIDRILGDGDALDIGDGVEIKLISTPGHTIDSVCYFVRPDAALACGETIGSFSGREKINNCCTANFVEYTESLEKLTGLDVRILGFPHSGVITGELVPKYFVEARQEVDRFRQLVKERIEQGELTNEIFESLLPEWQAQNISPEGPFVEEQRETLLSAVKTVAAA
jgi:2-aminobenzoylacetyl-CoA thioesterase